MTDTECTNPQLRSYPMDKYSALYATKWFACGECAYCKATHPNDRKASNPEERDNT